MTPDTVQQQAAHALGAPIRGGEIDWQSVLARRSFLELDALARARALLDDGSARVLCGPFERLESPWLEPQDVTPQSDDGVVIARGTIAGSPVVVASIEQQFQGGGIGEVSGMKISEALRLAAADSRAGTPVPAVLLLETGGVRLQEANLGLNAVAEICSALLELRPHAPVVAVIAGSVGSFGGVSIATGLCSHVIVTPEARIGLNGAAVIEQEAGAEEFDSSDRALIWAIDGGEQRRLTGLADTLVIDDVDELVGAVGQAIAAGVPAAGTHRSERLTVLEQRLATIDPSEPPRPIELRRLWGDTYDEPPAKRAKRATRADHRPHHNAERSSMKPSQRGRNWIAALAGDAAPYPIIGSVLRADAGGITYLAVVPDRGNAFYRARQGQVGVTECAALARAMREIAEADRDADERRAIVAIVDLPSQAYGRIEEMVGLHQAIATAVDATAAARVAGHPIVAIVVGQALSGGFLTHGLQASQILALDELAETIPPLSYDVRVWATLGFCDGLLQVENAESPTSKDVRTATNAIAAAICRARSGPTDLSNRLESDDAKQNRKASRAVRDALAREWNQTNGS
jgi:malonate decarboxylase beta subunit